MSSSSSQIKPITMIEEDEILLDPKVLAKLGVPEIDVESLGHHSPLWQAYGTLQTYGGKTHFSSSTVCHSSASLQDLTKEWEEGLKTSFDHLSGDKGITDVGILWGGFDRSKGPSGPVKYRKDAVNITPFGRDALSSFIIKSFSCFTMKDVSPWLYDAGWVSFDSIYIVKMAGGYVLCTNLPIAITKGSEKGMVRVYYSLNGILFEQKASKDIQRWMLRDMNVSGFEKDCKEQNTRQRNIAEKFLGASKEDPESPFRTKGECYNWSILSSYFETDRSLGEIFLIIGSLLRPLDSPGDAYAFHYLSDVH
jgi:hypothetical protein